MSKKVTFELSDTLDATLEQLAAMQGATKPEVLERALTLLKLAEDTHKDGYSLALTKDGQVEHEIETR